MTEFQLNLSDFNVVVGVAQEVVEDVSQSLSLAKDAESTFSSNESGAWADSFSKTQKTLVQTNLSDLNDVVSLYAGYYNSALEEANNLATNRDNLLEACGNSTSDSNIVYLSTGQHIPSKCSDAKESLTTLKINAQAVMYSDAWSSLKSNSTYYSTNVGVYRAKMNEYLSNLISDVDAQKTTLTQVSENYSTFKASVEDFEEIYSGYFSSDTITEVVQSNYLGNWFSTATASESDLKFLNKIWGWILSLGSLPADVLKYLDDPKSWKELLKSFDGSQAVLKSLGLDSKSIKKIKEIFEGSGVSGSNFQGALSAILNGTYVVGQMAEAWFTTDGDWTDKLSSTLTAGTWEVGKSVTKSAVTTACTAIGSLAGPAGAALGNFVGSVVGDFVVDIAFDALEDLGVKDAVNTVFDAAITGVTNLVTDPVGTLKSAASTVVSSAESVAVTNAEFAYTYGASIYY